MTATTENMGSARGAPHGLPPLVVRAYYLALLTAAYTLSQVDRQVLGILIEPVKREFSLTDGQIGLLNSGFSVAYMLLCIPVAALADRTNRRNLMALCLGLWSAFTAACGVASSFLQLLLFRIGVGAAESGGTPTALAMTADLFPPKQRSTALGILAMGSSLGALVAFGVGGLAADAYGWRAACMIVGVPGLILAALIFLTLKEPRRGQSDGAAQPPDPMKLLSAFKVLLTQPSAARLLLGIFAFNVPYSALIVWFAPFYARTHELPLSHVGPTLGLIIGAFGAAGAALGGAVADSVYKRSLRAVPLYLAVTYLMVGAAAAAALTAGSATMAFAFTSLWIFLSAFGTGPKFALLQGVVHPGMRAVTSAVMALLLNLAFAVGPQVSGSISEAMTRQGAGTGALRVGLLSICVCYPVAALLFAWASRTITRDTGGVQRQLQANP